MSPVTLRIGSDDEVFAIILANAKRRRLNDSARFLGMKEDGFSAEKDIGNTLIQYL